MVHIGLDQLQFFDAHSRMELRTVRYSTCSLICPTDRFHLSPRSAGVAGLRVGCSGLLFL